MNLLKKWLSALFSTSAAGLYILLFAFSIGLATFIENDFGTSAAQKVIFKTHWFEMILVLFGISLIVNIFKFRMVQAKKWGTLTFHAAMVIIILGAGVTRYFGREGMMGIREGSASNSFLSAETYLNFQVQHGEKRYSFDEPVLFASLGDNHFKKSYLIGNEVLEIEVNDFIPNPKQVMEDDPNGTPIIKVVVAGMNGREEYLVRYKEFANIRGTIFNFGNPEDPGAFNIKFEDNNLSFLANSTFSQMVMATQERDTLVAGVYHPLRLRSMYSNGRESFVFGDFNPAASAKLTSESPKMKSNSTGGLDVTVRFGSDEQKLFVSGMQGVEGSPEVANFSNGKVAVAYGAKRVELPFAIQLRDFIMERYPGTNSASSYASEVTLLDQRKNLKKDTRIYMNNILNYDGYRFFQSSFDQDELGTYLSVNYDAPGTMLSYLGYFLLTLGMILTLLSKNSRFQQLAQSISRLRQSEKAVASVLLLICLSLPGQGICGPPAPHLQNIDPAHAREFGKVLIQDPRGRMKPMNTFTSEILRKLSHKNSYNGQSADQVILSMASNPEAWYDEPLIKIGKQAEINKLLELSENVEYASYNDCFFPNGEYKLKAAARSAFNAPARERGTFEKAIVKLDEKVNICSMVFSGSFMKVFPVPGDETNTWMSPTDAQHLHNPGLQGSIIEQFYPMYIPGVQEALITNNWERPTQMVSELRQYQQKYGTAVLPSQGQIKAELLLNKLNIFGRLAGLYGLLGLGYLFLLFSSVFKPSAQFKKVSKITLGILFFGFAMHTLGLGLRWYVSERAPWSNGYESMIYIGWTTMLAGLIFARKSFGALAATNVLAATILMVAGLSWLDPEITPLVPVLKSYWLTIHVSMEAGSYGFLVLGAIIGMLNLIFMIFANQKNKERVYRIIREMSMISEMTLIGGLFMVSIGTYLGGVWANESWGRYWGWDAKETWALVTILVYSFILHMRFIPGLKGLYAFNVATLFGWATVAMTYFGVNYYLSGLHSYAAGDPVPIPDFVYYIVGSLIVISLAAAWKHRRFGIS